MINMFKEAGFRPARRWVGRVGLFFCHQTLGFQFCYSLFPLNLVKRNKKPDDAPTAMLSITRTKPVSFPQSLEPTNQLSMFISCRWVLFRVITDINHPVRTASKRSASKAPKKAVRPRHPLGATREMENEKCLKPCVFTAPRCRTKQGSHEKRFPCQLLRHNTN